MPTSVSWAKRIQECQPGFEHAEGGFRNTIRCGRGRSAGVGWVPVRGVPPALGSDSACGAGGDRRSSRFSPRSVEEQRLDNGLGPALLIREDLLDGLHQALAAPTQ